MPKINIPKINIPKIHSSQKPAQGAPVGGTASPKPPQGSSAQSSAPSPTNFHKSQFTQPAPNYQNPYAKGSPPSPKQPAGHNVSTQSAGDGGSSKTVQHPFLKQPHTHPDNKLCAFYALHHFTDGKVTKNDFIDKATSVYTDIGLSKEDALEMVLDGNDPATLGQFGLRPGDYATLQQKGVGIVADTDKGHFFTVRKEDARWFSYDSYNHNEPKQYATFDDLKQAEIRNSGVWVGE